MLITRSNQDIYDAQQTAVGRGVRLQNCWSLLLEHGGILAEGSSFIRYGENGKGIGWRWYPETIAKRLLNLSQVADRGFITSRCVGFR